MMLCDYCGAVFPTSATLKEHREANNHFPYCNHCQRGFSSVAAMEQHKMTSGKHRLCDLCPSMPPMDYPDQYSDHMALVHYHCTACSITFGSARQLQMHHVTLHDKCSVCFQWTHHEAGRDEHLHRQHGNLTLKDCFGCQERYFSHSVMLSHIELGLCPSRFTKPIIDQLASGCKFASYYVLPSGNSWLFKCPSCLFNHSPLTFTTISALVAHVESDACRQTVEIGSPLGELLIYLRSQMREASEGRDWRLDDWRHIGAPCNWSM